MLIKELGASPFIDSSDAEQYEQTVVIAQIPGEAPKTFAERVAHRLSLAAHPGLGVSVAQLYVGLAQDQAQRRARQSILVALAKCLRAADQPAQLLLEIPSGIPAATRRQLFEAVNNTLSSTHDGKLSVRFRIGAPRSSRRVRGKEEARPRKKRGSSPRRRTADSSSRVD